MNSSFIDKCLRRKFITHKYQLSNSFVYNEESDFFSMTTSDYAQEIEVKVSKSDFKADFKKMKHNDFKQLYKGQKYVVRRGRVVWKIYEPIMENAVGEDGKGIWEEDKYGRKRPKRVPTDKYRAYESHLGESAVKKKIEQDGCKAEAMYTSIRIFTPKLPNKFWFAVPEGLVTVDEVPDYAGLMYVTEDGQIKEIKRAPFIHKEKHDLKQVLLDKFYYLSQKLENSLRYNNHA